MFCFFYFCEVNTSRLRMPTIWVDVWGKAGYIYLYKRVWRLRFDCVNYRTRLIYLYVARYRAQLTRANKCEKKMQVSNQNTLLAAVLYRCIIEPGVHRYTINFLIIRYFGWKCQRAYYINLLCQYVTISIRSLIDDSSWQNVANYILTKNRIFVFFLNFASFCLNTFNSLKINTMIAHNHTHYTPRRFSGADYYHQHVLMNKLNSRL